MSDEKESPPAAAPSPTHGKEALRARFATPIEADRPVNPDESAREQFDPPPPAEQDAREPAKS